MASTIIGFGPQPASSASWIPLVQQCQPAPASQSAASRSLLPSCHHVRTRPGAAILGVQPLNAPSHDFRSTPSGRVHGLVPDDFIANLENVVAFTTSVAGQIKTVAALPQEDLVAHQVTFGDV